MGAIWQFILKYEFWVLMAIAVGLAIGHEISKDALFAGLSNFVGITAIVRLAMHPMWKKSDQGEEK